MASCVELLEVEHPDFGKKVSDPREVRWIWERRGLISSVCLQWTCLQGRSLTSFYKSMWLISFPKLK